MVDHSSINNRPLAEVESEEFRALGLTPAHWIALAPVPLFRSDLNLPHADDLQTLAKLQQPLRQESHHIRDPERIAESKLFWSRLCQRFFPQDALELSQSLFAWFLATRTPRTDRERYLAVLDNTSAKFSRAARSQNPSALPSYALRQRVERYLPHSRYTRYPADPVVAPPSPQQAAELLGPALWKQMLVAPVAGALADLHVRVAAAANVAEVLSHVSIPTPNRSPYPLEPHLAAGSWRKFFDGLLNPARYEETKPLIQAGMDIAARGLASLPYAERESLLQMIHEQILRGIEQPDMRSLTASSWVDQVRVKVENVICLSEPGVLAPTLPPKAYVTPTAKPGPVAVEAAPTGTDPQPVVATATPPAGRPNLQPDSMNPVNPPSSPPPVPMPTPLQAPPCVVEKASPFEMVSWDQALAMVGRISFAALRSWLTDPNRPPLLFDDCRSECPEVAIVRNEKLVPPVLWLVGDLHADLLTLANIIAHARRCRGDGAEPPAFVFLGDFVDRGRHDHETLLLLCQLMAENPGRVCVIPGNHDVDLQWDEKAGRFRVSIEPAEYCERLNSQLRVDHQRSREEVEFAKLLIPFWQERPKAAVLPDGTFLAHGGFPHTDLLDKLRSPADLREKNCLSDFMWARLAETARKRPNRGNRGHEFGWETFNQFCRVSAQIGLPPVKRFVRGHDHVFARWQYYPDYSENPVLTINAMGRRMDGEPESGGTRHPFPVMARYVPNKLPVVVLLPLDPREVDRAFGRETPASATSGAQSQVAESVSATAPGSAGDAMDAVALGVRLDALPNLVPKPGSDARS